MAVMCGYTDEKAREGVKAFMGNGSSKASEIAAMWMGDENNKAQFFFKNGVEAGEVVFTESTTWTVPEGVSTVDIFCVGGGGGAGGSFDRYSQSSSSSTYFQRYGGGGGGGYTTTQKSVEVAAGEELTIVVGAGGASGVSYWYDSTMSPTYGGNSTNDVSDGSDGGSSSVVDENGTVLCTADGGKGGAKTPTTSTTFSNVTYRRGGAGGAGGSGGAGGMFRGLMSGREMEGLATSGGTDGSDGGTAETLVDSAGTYANTGAVGGTGQGTTTRAFGESNGTLYSTGGSGGGDGKPLSGANTGDGGGVKAEYLYTSPYLPGGDGKSGIVIIRWAAQ